MNNGQGEIREAMASIQSMIEMNDFTGKQHAQDEMAKIARYITAIWKVIEGEE